MNAGIQDAEVLVPSLVAALDIDDPAPLLEYERVSRGRVAGV